MRVNYEAVDVPRKLRAMGKPMAAMLLGSQALRKFVSPASIPPAHKQITQIWMRLSLTARSDVCISVEEVAGIMFLFECQQSGVILYEQ